MKKTLIYLLITAAGLAILLLLFRQNKLAAGEVILYYGSTCPHCLKVEEYISANKIEEKIKITKKEVFNNQTNALEATKNAKTCGLPIENGVSVPLLWDGQKCYLGDADIIDYLKQFIQ